MIIYMHITLMVMQTHYPELIDPLRGRLQEVRTDKLQYFKLID